MREWLKDIDLSRFSVQIEGFVNHLVDPASLAIPNDPVFVSYRTPEQLRLMSASSLQEMMKQMEESRQFVTQAPLDPSEIALVVNSSPMDKPNEAALKDILRFCVEKGMKRAEIRMLSNVLNLGLIQALNVARDNELLSLRCVGDLKHMIGADNAHLVDDYLKILRAPDKASGFKLLPQYLEELITQQAVELETQRKKLRDEKGDDLKPQEVICPLTRHVIDVEQSLATQAKADQFMMLVVVLAQLAKMNNNELDEFVNSQESNYVMKCYEFLENYVQNSKQYEFTEEQQKLLNQWGMEVVVQKWQSQVLQETVGDSENKENANEASQQLRGLSVRFFGLRGEQRSGAENSLSYTP